MRKCNILCCFTLPKSLHFLESYFCDLSNGSDGVGDNGYRLIITISLVERFRLVNNYKNALGILSKAKHYKTLNRHSCRE